MYSFIGFKYVNLILGKEKIIPQLHTLNREGADSKSTPGGGGGGTLGYEDFRFWGYFFGGHHKIGLV